jgi:hypothetical protein
MKITKRQLHHILREYHPRADDDYDPLNPEDDDEDDAAYDQGYDDGFNGYPSEPVIGGDYHAGYEEGVNAAKDEDSRAEHDEEFGPGSSGMMGPPRREGKIKITKRQLKRIIKEEKSRLLETHGETHLEPAHWDVSPNPDYAGAPCPHEVASGIKESGASDSDILNWLQALTEDLTVGAEGGVTVGAEEPSEEFSFTGDVETLDPAESFGVGLEAGRSGE